METLAVNSEWCRGGGGTAWWGRWGVSPRPRCARP